MNKKLIIILLAICYGYTIKSQNIFDFYNLTVPSINGTARYMSMAGSFGALGGDVSAIEANPATLGIFRSNEINFSLGLNYIVVSSKWNNLRFGKVANNFSLKNFNWVLNFPSGRDFGYMSSNFTIGYHRLTDFNRAVAIGNNDLQNSITDLMANITNDLTEKDLKYVANSYDPYNNPNIAYLSVLGYDGYLINPKTAGSNQWESAVKDSPIARYNLQERGYIDNYNISYSGNISDRIYFGIGLSLDTYVKYMQSEYSEAFPDGNKLFLRNGVTIRGLGTHFNLGIIGRITPNIRLGASISTPNTMSFSNNQKSTLNSTLAKGVLQTPNLDWKYKYTTPLKAQLSAGFIIASRAAINIDYIIYANNNQRLIGEEDDAFKEQYRNENSDFRKLTKPSHTIKLGAEIKVASKVKLRGGMAYMSSPFSSNAVNNFSLNTTRTNMEYFISQSQIFTSCGIGFNFNNIFLDFAYVYRSDRQDFIPFETFNKSIKGKVTNNYHSIIATFAWKY